MVSASMRQRSSWFIQLCLVTTALIAPALLVACQPVPTGDFTDTTWTLQLSEEGQTSTLVPFAVTLQFLSTDACQGTFGLQKYAGSYAVAGDRIEFHDMRWTTMSCMSAGGTLGREQAYVFALEAAQAYSLSADTLTIHTAKGEVLTYTRG